MSFITWSDDLSVGNEEIDSQHKQFVVIINQMHDAMKSGSSGHILPDILKKLSDYVAYHFTFEERFMAECQYPALSLHKHIHTHFAIDTKKTIQEHTEGKILISLKIMNSLKDWLITHIMVEDKKYAVHAQNQLMRNLKT